MNFKLSYLQADSSVDSAAEGSRDCSGTEAEPGKQFGEGLGEGNSRPLLSHHDASSHARQVDPSLL